MGHDPTEIVPGSSLVWRLCRDWEAAPATAPDARRRCPRGVRCRFLHLSRDSSFDARLEATAQMTTLLRDSYIELDKERARRQAVCLFFARGELCHGGYACPDAHATPFARTIVDVRTDVPIGVPPQEPAYSDKPPSPYDTDPSSSRPLAPRDEAPAAPQLPLPLSGTQPRTITPPSPSPPSPRPARSALVATRHGETPLFGGGDESPQSDRDADWQEARDRWTVCTYYDKHGKCWNGKQCYYFHGGGPNGLDCRPDKEESMRQDLEFFSATHAEEIRESQKQRKTLLCAFYRAGPGKCLGQPSPTPTVNCPYFIRGVCSYGDACWRTHTSPVHVTPELTDFRLFRARAERRDPPVVEIARTPDRENDTTPETPPFEVSGATLGSKAPVEPVFEWTMEPLNEVGFTMRCTLCDAKLNENTRDSHLRGQKHREKIETTQRVYKRKVTYIGPTEPVTQQGENNAANTHAPAQSNETLALPAELTGPNPAPLPPPLICGGDERKSTSALRAQEKLTDEERNKLKLRLLDPPTGVQEDPDLKKLRLGWIVPNPMPFGEERMDCLACKTFVTGVEPALTHLMGDQHKRQLSCEIAGKKLEEKRAMVRAKREAEARMRQQELEARNADEARHASVVYARDAYLDGEDDSTTGDVRWPRPSGSLRTSEPVPRSYRGRTTEDLNPGLSVPSGSAHEPSAPRSSRGYARGDRDINQGHARGPAYGEVADTYSVPPSYNTGYEGYGEPPPNRHGQPRYNRGFQDAEPRASRHSAPKDAATVRNDDYARIGLDERHRTGNRIVSEPRAVLHGMQEDAAGGGYTRDGRPPIAGRTYIIEEDANDDGGAALPVDLPEMERIDPDLRSLRRKKGTAEVQAPNRCDDGRRLGPETGQEPNSDDDDCAPKVEVLVEKARKKPRVEITHGFEIEQTRLKANVRRWKATTPEKADRMLRTLRRLQARARVSLADPRPRPDLESELELYEQIEKALLED